MSAAEEKIPAQIRYMIGMSVDAIGSGMYLPVSLLYFHYVTGLPIAEVGLILTAGTLFRLVGNAFVGPLVDRFGAQKIVVVGYLLRAIGLASYLLVDNSWQMFLAVAVVSIGDGSYPPAIQSFVAESVAGSNRDKLIGAQRSFRNAGLGVGGLIAGAALALGSTSTVFMTIIVADVATFLIAALLIYSIPRSKQTQTTGPRPKKKGSSITVLRDRPFMALTLLNLPTALGYMVLSVALPVYLTQQLQLPDSLIGVLYAVNTVGIALLQIPVTKLISKFRRSRCVAAGGLVFCLAFLLFAVLGFSNATGFLVGGVFLATALFTVGELMHGTSASALAASAAPDEMRGRYLSVYQLSWSIPTALAPAVLTGLLSVSPTIMWLALAVGTVVSALGMLKLESHLPVQAIWTGGTRPGEEAQVAGSATKQVS